MENLEVEGKELKKFFASYWLLHSALYDFAHGLENQDKRRFTWAITNYYYSLMFIGRLLMFLPTDLYYTAHKDLGEFFKGEEVESRQALEFENGEFRRIRVDDNRENNQSDREEVRLEEVASGIKVEIEKIKKFGEILEQMRIFRNKNTYEAFVIYAQENHTILTEFIFSATDRIRVVTENYLKEMCKVFFNFWTGRSRQFVGLLNHEWVVPNTLQILEKHRLPVEHVTAIINKGFYFENEEVYKEELPRIRSMMEQKPDAELRRNFERVCKISEFGAKKRIIEKVFQNFKELIEIGGGN